MQAAEVCCSQPAALLSLAPILPPWNRCPAQFPSSCPPSHPLLPPPTTPCPILPFLPPNHPKLNCLHLPTSTDHFFKIVSPQTRWSPFSSRESGLTGLLLVFVHRCQLLLGYPSCPTGGLTLAVRGVHWPNTGAHGTQRCSTATCDQVACAPP